MASFHYVYDAIIYANAKVTIMDSCIIGNNNGLRNFFVASGSLTISNCTHDTKTNLIDKTIENTFINALSHIATHKCDSYLDVYWVSPLYFKAPSEIPTPASAPTEISTEYSDPTQFHRSPNLEYTPIPTWDGEWAEEPMIIIKDDDIPIIKGTHYPLQTDYVMTSVPSATAAANIGVGAIIMTAVIVSSVYNFLRSGQKLKKLLKNGKYDVDVNSDEFLSHSSSSSSKNTQTSL